MFLSYSHVSVCQISSFCLSSFRIFVVEFWRFDFLSRRHFVPSTICRSKFFVFDILSYNILCLQCFCLFVCLFVFLLGICVFEVLSYNILCLQCLIAWHLCLPRFVVQHFVSSVFNCLTFVSSTFCRTTFCVFNVFVCLCVCLFFCLAFVSSTFCRPTICRQPVTASSWA